MTTFGTLRYCDIIVLSLISSLLSWLWYHSYDIIYDIIVQTMISVSVSCIWYHSHDIIYDIIYDITTIIEQLLWYHTSYKNTQYHMILVYDIINNIIVDVPWYHTSISCVISYTHMVWYWIWYHIWYHTWMVASLGKTTGLVSIVADCKTPGTGCQPVPDSGRYRFPNFSE